MKKVLLIAVAGAIVAGSPVIAGAQEFQRARDFYLAAVQAQPAQPARPPAAPTAPVPVAPAAPQPAPAPAPPPAPAFVRQAPSPNVRFDVTITDTGGAKPVTKTMSLTIGSFNNSGSVRNTAQVPNPTPGPVTIPIPLNVDVRNVTWLENNGIRASVAVEYLPYVPEAKTQPGMITANAQTVFYDGRKTQILVASDPVSDRKTTIEVTATILK